MINKTNFLIGSYTTQLDHVDGQGQGISSCILDNEKGRLSEPKREIKIANPSFFCQNPESKILYCISEVSEYQNTADGYLSVYRFNEDLSKYTLIQEISSYGIGPAYVSLDATHQYLLLANYLQGNIVVYPIKNEGELAEPCFVHQQEGSSVHPIRQKQSHCHAILNSPDNSHLYIPNLGNDQVWAYFFNENTGEVTECSQHSTKQKAGSGPRHMVFHPSGHFAFVICELNNMILSYRYISGALELIDSQSTLPSDFNEESTSSELRVSACGRHLYSANRGHDSICVFDIDVEKGCLDQKQIISSHGQIPRTFFINSLGNYLVCANQDSHNIRVFSINQNDGTLSLTNNSIECSSPAYMMEV